MESTDTKILQVEGNKVKALKEGKAGLKFSNIVFHYEADGQVFRDVEYKGAMIL